MLTPFGSVNKCKEKNSISFNILKLTPLHTAAVTVLICQSRYLDKNKEKYPLKASNILLKFDSREREKKYEKSYELSI